MNTFYIARHGETENNRARRLSGWLDTPLTERGLEPTERAVEKLGSVPVDVMISSDIGRAFITAYEIAQAIGYTGIIERDARLREVNYGDAANMYSEEAYKLYPRLDRDTHFMPPNGESLATMQSRVLDCIGDLNTRFSDAHILIVAHSGDMAALRANQLGVDFGGVNISEAFAHDYVGVFTFADGNVQSFEELT